LPSANVDVVTSKANSDAATRHGAAARYFMLLVLGGAVGFRKLVERKQNKMYAPTALVVGKNCFGNKYTNHCLSTEFPTRTESTKFAEPDHEPSTKTQITRPRKILLLQRVWREAC
jgi:hypothetical protein